MTQIKRLLDMFTGYGVEFVIAGGVAASIQGLDQATMDLDICYARHHGNLERLAEMLAALHAALRNTPPELPFTADAETLHRGLNFAFNTDLGPLDLIGEVPGVGTFERAIAAADTIELLGRRYAVLSLPQLIAAKRAAGRPKDLLVLPALQHLYKRQQDESLKETGK